MRSNHSALRSNNWSLKALRFQNRNAMIWKSLLEQNFSKLKHTFLIQTMRETQMKLDKLIEKDRKKEEALAEEKKKAEEALASGYSDPTMGGGYGDPNGMVVYGAGMGMGGGMAPGYGGGGYGGY